MNRLSFFSDNTCITGFCQPENENPIPSETGSQRINNANTLQVK